MGGDIVSMHTDKRERGEGVVSTDRGEDGEVEPGDHEFRVRAADRPQGRASRGSTFQALLLSRRLFPQAWRERLGLLTNNIRTLILAACGCIDCKSAS